MSQHWSVTISLRTSVDVIFCFSSTDCQTSSHDPDQSVRASLSFIHSYSTEMVRVWASVFKLHTACSVHPETTLHPKITSTLCLKGHYQQPCNHLAVCNTAKTHHNIIGRQLQVCQGTLVCDGCDYILLRTFSGQLLRRSVIMHLKTMGLRSLRR